MELPSVHRGDLRRCGHGVLQDAMKRPRERWRGVGQGSRGKQQGHCSHDTKRTTHIASRSTVRKRFRPYANRAPAAKSSRATAFAPAVGPKGCVPGHPRSPGGPTVSGERAGVRWAVVEIAVWLIAGFFALNALVLGTSVFMATNGRHRARREIRQLEALWRMGSSTSERRRAGKLIVLSVAAALVIAVSALTFPRLEGP